MDTFAKVMVNLSKGVAVQIDGQAYCLSTDYKFCRINNDNTLEIVNPSGTTLQTIKKLTDRMTADEVGLLNE